MQQRQREEQQIVRDTSNWRQVTAATATWVSVGGEGVGVGDESQSLVAVAVVVGFATCPGTSRMTKMTTSTASAAAKTHRQVIKIITLCPRDAAAAAGGNNAHTRCAFYGPKPSPDSDRRLFPPLLPFDIIVMMIVLCFVWVCSTICCHCCLTGQTKTTTWHSLGM